MRMLIRAQLWSAAVGHRLQTILHELPALFSRLQMPQMNIKPCAGNLQERSQLVRMLIGAQLWSSAVPAAMQLLQRSQLHLDLDPQPPPEVCYELLAQASPLMQCQSTR